MDIFCQRYFPWSLFECMSLHYLYTCSKFRLIVPTCVFGVRKILW
jgi:hypothetical protein